MSEYVFDPTKKNHMERAKVHSIEKCFLLYLKMINNVKKRKIHHFEILNLSCQFQTSAGFL